MLQKGGKRENFVSSEKNFKGKSRFQSVYRQLRLVALPLLLLMTCLVALTVIRAARILIFDAYKDSTEFALKTLKEELLLTGLESSQVASTLSSARKRARHKREFMVVRDESPVALTKGFDKPVEAIKKAQKLLAQRPCYVEITGVGPFLRLFAALRLNEHYTLVMTEGAEFLTGNYLYYALIIIGLIFSGAFLVTFLFSNMLFKPMMKRLTQIRQALFMYGMGDSSVRLPIEKTRKDEFDLVCYEFNKMADTIDELKTKLLERIESEKKLLSALAHDINTPVTILRGHAENLLQHGNSLTPNQISSLSAGLLSQAIYIQTLVDDLLTMATTKVSSLTLVKQDVDLDGIFDSLVNTYEPLAAQWQVALIADAHGLRVNADPVRLSQILNNLVMNALRHATGATVIEISASRKDGGVVVTVCDDGPGVSEQVIQLIGSKTQEACKVKLDEGAFEQIDDNEKEIESPDKRASSKDGIRGKGWGLGLRIVRMLASMHGGWFRIKKGDRGRGACFQVWFPDPKVP